MAGTLNDPQVMRRVLTGRGRVAVIGASTNPEKASHQVAAYLLEHGFDVVPIHPRAPEILGRKAYPSLAEVPGDVDVVDVFRKPAALPKVMDEAIAKGAPVVWIQLGLVSEEAARKGQAAGVDVVMDRCMKQEHRKLS